MKKFIGLALVPVLLASIPLAAFSFEPTTSKVDKETHKVKAVDGAKGDRVIVDRVKGDVSKITMNKIWTGAGMIRETFSTPDVRTTFNKAQWQLVEKNYGDAIELFETVLKTDPSSVRTLHGVAIAYHLKGDNSVALDRIEKALALDPVNTKLLYTKGRILDTMGKEAEALEQYLMFVALDPTDSSAIIVERRADELFRRWDNRFSEVQRNYFNGLRFLSIEQPESAIPVLEALIKQEPGNVNGHFLLGIACRNLNQPSEAIRHFEVITQSQPDNPMAFYHLGVVYDQVGQKQNAKQAWKNFVQFAPHAEAVDMVNYHIQMVR